MANLSLPVALVVAVAFAVEATVSAEGPHIVPEGAATTVIKGAGHRNEDNAAHVTHADHVTHVEHVTHADHSTHADHVTHADSATHTDHVTHVDGVAHAENVTHADNVTRTNESLTPGGGEDRNRVLSRKIFEESSCTSADNLEFFNKTCSCAGVVCETQPEVESVLTLDGDVRILVEDTEKDIRCVHYERSCCCP